MRVPTRSAGTRSGVNCRRLNEPPSTSATVLTVSVLARPGHALEQHVAAGQQRDQHALEHRFLADDHALDLEQRLLERIVCRARGGQVFFTIQRPQAALFGSHAIVSVS